MVLRRVMSGWLIALAALARAMAAALERAASERSEPAIDPVMAELRERYPDAPAHWLAFVAERMSAEARNVEAAAPGIVPGPGPGPGNVKPVAWPSTDAGEPSPASALEAAGPDGLDPPVAEPSVAAEALPARRRQAPSIPTMAELASRSTETWRGPGASPRRPSRPVFARPVDPPSTAPVSPTLEPPPPAATPRGPRSPLALAPRQRLPAGPHPRDLEQTGEGRAAEGQAAERAPVERGLEAFREGPRGEQRTQVATSVEDRAPKAATPSWREVRGGEDRVDRLEGARQAEPVSAARFETARPPVALPRFPETSAGQVPRTPPADPASRRTPAGQVPRTPPASPASRAAPAASRSERPDRSPAAPALATAKLVKTRSPIDAAPAARPPSMAWWPSPPGVRRSFIRRLIDKAVASAPHGRPALDAAPEAPAGGSPSSSLPSPVPPSVPSGSAHFPSGIAHRASHPVAGPDLAPAGDAAGGEQWGVASRPAFEPAREPSSDVTGSPSRHDDRTAAGPAWTPSSSRLPRRREFAVSTRRPAPLEATARDPASAVDDRWPALPPWAFAPTPTVEAPAPRWSRLAREQEEGLWNA